MKPIFFSSGPSKKFPEWHSSMFDSKLLNRTHIYDFKIHLKDCLILIRQILGIPEHYELFFVPGSGSGAVFCAFLHLLDPNRKVQAPITGFFSNEWAAELENQFKLNCTKLRSVSDVADRLQPGADSVVVWSDTTNGFCYANAFENYNANEEDIVIVDAVCAAFLEDIPWHKLDAIAFSAQKILGGDGSIGILALSPKALKRVAVKKDWPIPRMFNINKWGLHELVEGRAMSTPSVLAAIELMEILKWIERNGGLTSLKERNKRNWQVVSEFVEKNKSFEYLIKEEKNRCRALVCLELAVWPSNLAKMEFMAMIAKKAQQYEVYDIASFANPSWRFWIGPMQEASHVREGLDRFKSCFDQV